MKNPITSRGVTRERSFTSHTTAVLRTSQRRDLGAWCLAGTWAATIELEVSLNEVRACGFSSIDRVPLL